MSMRILKKGAETMYFLRLFWISLILVIFAAMLPIAPRSIAEQGNEWDVSVWISGFPVSPSHMPVLYVDVHNFQETEQGLYVRLDLPEGWEYQPERQQVKIPAGETLRVPFSVTKGVYREENRYPVGVELVVRTSKERFEREVRCTSAPYLKPAIDGKTDDWDDTIPVSWEKDGKTTTISTAWSRRNFFVLVAVEEDRWKPAGQKARDAVQLAIAPKRARTGTEPEDPVARYEYLLLSDGETASLNRLATPETPSLAVTAESRDPEELPEAAGEVKIWHTDGVTYYECAIAMRSIREIRPGAGREFCFSLLVHDPDGTGLRDWGEAVDLPKHYRRPLAWSRWQGDAIGENGAMDNKIPWGMCSSKY
jgi:hypothetical protein